MCCQFAEEEAEGEEEIVVNWSDPFELGVGMVKESDKREGYDAGKDLRRALREVLREFGFEGVDRLELQLGENCGIKRGEVVRYI